MPPPGLEPEDDLPKELEFDSKNPALTCMRRMRTGAPRTRVRARLRVRATASWNL